MILTKGSWRHELKSSVAESEADGVHEPPSLPGSVVGNDGCNANEEADL